MIGKKKREWQDVEYILDFFGRSVGKARKGYVSYVKKGIPLGRRPELVGGGLIRSLGSWVEKDYITGRGRQKDRVRARDLLFYWTVVELGMPMVDLARKFDITPAAVSYAVQRGEKMTKEQGYQLEA